MEKWSKGYAVTKIFVYYAFWLSHKRIAVLGKENIPKNKPVIFAPNHQNALMDPLAVLLTNRTQPVWLARADIFKLKFTRPILKFLKIVPVYRIRDGKENLQNNEETFDLAVRVLENKKVMALFPEGAHSGKKQMIAHKKAVPRIAFLAEEKNDFKLDLQIIPIGIYYSHYWKFNRSVIVNYGTPISVSKYKELFRKNENAANIAMRDDIYTAIQSLSIDIKSREYYEEYELILILAGDRYEKIRQYKDTGDKLLNRFFSDKELTERMETFEMNDPDTFKNIVSDLRSFRAYAQQLGLPADRIKRLNTYDFISIIPEIILALISFPLFIPGFIFNGPQFLISRSLIKKKVNDPIFKSTFNLVIGMILFPVSHLCIAIIIGMLLHSLLVIIILFLIMPLLGKFSWQLFEFYKNIAGQLKLLYFVLFMHKQTTTLFELQKDLEDKIIDAAENNSIIFEA